MVAHRHAKQLAFAPVAMIVGDPASCLRVSTSSLCELARGGELPGQKVGERWQFRKVAVDAWIIAGDNRVSGGLKRGASQR